jgi:putative Ca2+/H+ antiporter (TMEM165/GDT1 family)
MLHPFWATYLAVLAAEILGDKFLYTTGVLSIRYRTFPMMIGIAVAFMVKMGAAVAVGDALAHLPRLVVAGVTASGMIAIAVRFWRESAPSQPVAGGRGNVEAAMMSCGSVMFSEWADLGQLTAAAMAVQFQAPMPVFVGAVSAMVTKGLVVATVGAQLRGRLQHRVPAAVVRYGGAVLFVLVGVVSMIETLMARR